MKRPKQRDKGKLVVRPSGGMAGPEWDRFESDMRRDLIPKMRDSAAVLVLSPDISHKFDIGLALQIGASVLLEKPLVVVINQDWVIPPKLERMADRIIRADMSTEQGRKEVHDQMAQFFNDFGRQ